MTEPCNIIREQPSERPLQLNDEQLCVIMCLVQKLDITESPNGQLQVENPSEILKKETTYKCKAQCRLVSQSSEPPSLIGPYSLHHPTPPKKCG